MTERQQKWIASVLLMFASTLVITRYVGASVPLSLLSGVIIVLFVNWLWNKFPDETSDNTPNDKPKRKGKK